MPPRTLDALAHALGAAPDLDGALIALGESLAEIERSAYLGVARHDARSGMLTELLVPGGPRVERSALEVALTHLAQPIAFKVAAGAQYVECAEQSGQYAKLLGFRSLPEGGSLALKGIRVDGQLSAVVAVYEAKRVFGTRAVERFEPAIALFELAFARFVEREARAEAARTLEDVTRRVHAEYIAKLSDLESQLAKARGGGTPEAARSVTAERVAAKEAEELRRAQQRLRALEQQVATATAQLEHAHVELHRRSELLRQRSRTLYLLERVLALAASSEDPRALAEGLLALVGDDLQAQRCSLLLRHADGESLYLAAARGLAPHVKEGKRTKIGEGVSGRVALTREPLLVVDPDAAGAQPLLGDEYLTTGSFISFPLVLHDQLIGVVNVTNRVHRGLFVEEDVERVRLLGLVCALAAAEARLPERLEGALPRVD